MTNIDHKEAGGINTTGESADDANQSPPKDGGVEAGFNNPGESSGDPAQKARSDESVHGLAEEVSEEASEQETQDQIALRNYVQALGASTKEFWHNLSPIARKTYMYTGFAAIAATLIYGGVEMGKSEVADDDATMPDEPPIGNMAGGEEYSQPEDLAHEDRPEETGESTEGSSGHEEVLNSEIPPMITERDVEIETQIRQRTQLSTSPESREDGESITFKIWRGAVMAEFPVDNPLHEHDTVYLRMENPVEVLLPDPSGKYESLAYWAAYNKRLQKFVSLPKGYVNNGETKSRPPEEIEVKQWSLLDSPHSGQWARGRPEEITSFDFSLRDTYASCIRGEGYDIESEASLHYDRREARDQLSEPLHVGRDDEQMTRDARMIEELDC